MANRIFRKYELKVSTDSAGVQVVSDRSDSYTDTASTDYAVDGNRQIAATVNAQIDLAGVTTTAHVHIETDAAINIRTGVADDPIALAPVATGLTGVFSVDMVATEIWIENPSASTSVNVYFLIAGS